ncbi:NIPSNAP family protein [Streptomyces sp. NPDC102441]|uniref:NIPSNAP family protein n=1 Tax=Streptomyces sp. NPDC102441 TaxID=3366176 RepID=UPI0038161158
MLGALGRDDRLDPPVTVRRRRGRPDSLYQETGMTVLGQFRDLDDPDRFVWLRGFASMETRSRALASFYGGPVWAEHGPQANDTMIDSDDVLLLRPVSADSGFTRSPSLRPEAGTPAPDGFVAATVWPSPPGRHDMIALIRDGLLSGLMRTGPAPLALLTTETARNTFPRLPVRTGENVAVIVTSYPDEDAHRRHLAALHADPRTRDEILPCINRARSAAPRTLRLAPTGRSLIS